MMPWSAAPHRTSSTVRCIRFTHELDYSPEASTCLRSLSTATRPRSPGGSTMKHKNQNHGLVPPVHIRIPRDTTNETSRPASRNRWGVGRMGPPLRCETPIHRTVALPRCIGPNRLPCALLAKEHSRPPGNDPSDGMHGAGTHREYRAGRRDTKSHSQGRLHTVHSIRVIP